MRSSYIRQFFHFGLGAAFLLVISALVAVASLSFKNTSNLIAADVWVSHTHEVIAELESTRNSLAHLASDSKAAPKAELSNYLEVSGHFSQLQKLTADNPHQQTRLLALQAQLRPTMAPDENKYRESLRVLQDMKSEEELLLTKRTTHARDVSKATLRAIIILSVVAVSVCILSYWALLKNLSVRERSEKALAKSESRLRDLLAREQELSRVDPLTTVLNRRGFYEALEKERVRTLRYQHPITIAYLDLDNFKKVNDSLGHAIGDELLIQVAATLRSNLRRSDVVGRLGGDEFALILPETNANGAKVALGKLRLSLLEAMRFQDFAITFSIGAATFLSPPNSLDILIRMADETMYAIKAKGKDNVSVCVMG